MQKNRLGKILKYLLIGMLLFTSSAYAELNCEVELNYGLVVSENRIRVLDESRTLYQINSDDQLIVGGHWIEVDGETAKDLRYFSDGIHYVVPKMIILATEGVDLAIDTVQHVYTGLVGTDHKTFEKLEKSLSRVKDKVKHKFIQSKENFYIGPGSLEKVDEIVDRELEEQIEQAIDTSLGGVLSAIGGLASPSDAAMEERIEDLSQKLEIMGEEIERTVGPKADTLRKKAHWFCQKMKKLDKIENKLRSQIPEMKEFDVIIVGD